MTKEEILETLLNRLGDGSWFLLALKVSNEPLLKERLRDKVNELYQEKMGTNDLLIPSRHSLDIWTARLEGAGLVDVQEIGRARIFKLSNLAFELLEYKKQKKG
jgi:hypothetical protein